VADGFEQQFGVNYLGHFLLTQKLLPVLQKAPKARIVHLASIAHWAGSIKPNKFRAEGFYNPLFYYGQSKLANLLISNALAEQMTNSTITNNALHPGGVASDIYRDLPKPVYEVMLEMNGQTAMVNMSVHICQTGNHHMLKTNNLHVTFMHSLCNWSKSLFKK